MIIANCETYLDAVRDAIDVVERREYLLGATPGERLFARVVLSELRSLHPEGRESRERSRADKLEALVDDIADRVVDAAQYDYETAQANGTAYGNAVASIPFSFPATCKWLRYAAGRGSERAKMILQRVADKGNDRNESEGPAKLVGKSLK